MSIFEKVVSHEREGRINMEQNGYDSIGCYTFYVTLSYDFNLGFWRSN